MNKFAQIYRQINNEMKGGRDEIYAKGVEVLEVEECS